MDGMERNDLCRLTWTFNVLYLLAVNIMKKKQNKYLVRMLRDTVTTHLRHECTLDLTCIMPRCLSVPFARNPHMTCPLNIPFENGAASLRTDITGSSNLKFIGSIDITIDNQKPGTCRISDSLVCPGVTDIPRY